MNLFDYSRFVRHLPYYFSDYRSRHICSQLGLGHGYIAINKSVFFQCPSNPIAHSVFRDMAFCAQTRNETKEFLELSAGCCNFVDIGASGGFFSVLFAVSRTEASTILSIEPDGGAYQVLVDLCERNQRKTVKWEIDLRGVMHETRKEVFVSSGYGAEVTSVRALNNARQRAGENNLVSTVFEVHCAKLDDIISDHFMHPDIIKIDIESFEFELVHSSLDFLRRWRPRIMLELHVALLQARGRDPELLLASLDSIGYRRFLKPRKELHTLLTEADASGVVRAGLLPDRVA